VELTDWISAHSDDAKSIVNAAIKRIVGKPLPPAVLESAWGRVRFTPDPIKDSITQSARWAFEQGHLGRSEPDLSGLVDMRWLPTGPPAAPPKK
jgi:NitT/TauT family transport system substrate-binding protein